jgi:hypothetical protein
MPAMTKMTIPQNHAYHANVVHILCPPIESLCCAMPSGAICRSGWFSPFTQRCLTNPWTVLTARGKDLTFQDNHGNRALLLAEHPLEYLARAWCEV